MSLAVFCWCILPGCGHEHTAFFPHQQSVTFLTAGIVILKQAPVGCFGSCVGTIHLSAITEVEEVRSWLGCRDLKCQGAGQEGGPKGASTCSEEKGRRVDCRRGDLEEDSEWDVKWISETTSKTLACAPRLSLWRRECQPHRDTAHPFVSGAVAVASGVRVGTQCLLFSLISGSLLLTQWQVTDLKLLSAYLKCLQLRSSCVSDGAWGDSCGQLLCCSTM